MAKSEVKWIRLGEFVLPSDKRNTEDKQMPVMGLNAQKTFMPTVANLTDVDLSKYKVVNQSEFAFSGMQTGRDECIRIAISDCEKPFLISPAYSTFMVDKSKGVLPEYVFMYFFRAEMDRYGWFISDSSVRANLDWPRLMDIQIPVPYTDGKPDLEKQRVVVDAWQGLRKMKEDNEQLVEPLMQLCRSYMESVKKKYNPTHIGPFIHRQDIRNHDNKIKIVKSVSVRKVFNDTNAKVDKNNLSSYKVVMPNQMSFVQTTHNEKCLCVAVNKYDYPVVVTSVNEVFSTDENVLLPDFLYLFLTRKEFDRYARFHSWGSARETFDWDDMCKVKIPIPSPEEQQAIIDIYKCAERAKHIAEEADRLSREICPALMQHIIHEN